MKSILYSIFLWIFLCCSCIKEQERFQNNQGAAPLLYLHDNNLEATLWAESPQLYNPTNIDVDIRGRLWVTEAVNYRDFNNSDGHLFREEGDRIMILEDTNGDGIADSSKVFVQDKDLLSPLGIAVIGNKVIVSCSPSVIVYTDENGDDKPDSKEVFLTGFGGFDHDHSLHAGVAGPDGKLYFIAGNQGPHIVTDKGGWTLRSGSVITGGSPYATDNTPALKSDDGKIWTGGLAFRINPDGTGLEVLAHNFRNSYEVFVDSFGNLWQNDNDDQVATCRTTWIMEGGNAGYLNQDGSRTWQADQRPGQSIETAHWHQEDPGVMHSGDIYGAGSPTGIVMHEGDELGQKHRGLLLSADAGRNIIFGYMPKLSGAGYYLDDRTHFIASVDIDNVDYRWNEVDEDKSKWFRPSDVAIGTDGAIFVADWYDPIVGGHQMHDKNGYGRIYRIAPKDKILKAPLIDLSNTQGQVLALLSPAINVRNQGFEMLKAQGEKAIPRIKDVLASDNPFHRARAVWLLAQLGEMGVREAEALLDDKDADIRITALRALRMSAPDRILEFAEKLAEDKSSAVRRELAISLKESPIEISKETILTIIEGYDGKDPWYLTAIGIALQGKEEAIYTDLLQQYGSQDPENWSLALTNLVWELHPPSSVKALSKRAASDKLSFEERKKSLVALAFIPTREASDAVKQLSANESGDITNLALYWLQFRKTNDWREYLENWKPAKDNMPKADPEALKLREIVANTNLEMGQRTAAASQLAASKTGKLHLIHLFADKKLPDTVVNVIQKQLIQEKDPYLKPLIAHFFNEPDSASYHVNTIANLTVDVEKGKTLTYSNCLSCHKIGNAGGELGPFLTNIQDKYDKTGIIDAIVHPSAGIAFGSEPYLITLKNGAILYGVLLSGGPVVTVMDIYGRRHMVENNEVYSKKMFDFSPMPSPQFMKLTEQDVADIAAFLLQKSSVSNNTK